MIRTRRLFSGTFLYIGPWAMRFTRPSRGATYSNGSHWHSPWYRWREEQDG